jgi:hypothetical protein
MGERNSIGMERSVVGQEECGTEGKEERWRAGL